MNTTNTYGAGGNKFGHANQDGVERFWRHLLAAAASMRFHRPDFGLDLNDKAVACIRTARHVESLRPLWFVNPANLLLSGREPNEAYAPAEPGEAYVRYFPSGGEVALDLSGAEGDIKIPWINIDKGQLGVHKQLDPRSVVPIKASGNWNSAAVTVRPEENK